MRFMMLMYPNLDAKDWLNTDDPESVRRMGETLAEMGKFNDELNKAGVLLALDGLHNADEAVRITWDSGAAVAHDGPFAEAKEVVGGYWIIQVRSKEEAVEWAKRIPGQHAGQVVELRQIQEHEEFSQEIQDAVLQAQG